MNKSAELYFQKLQANGVPEESVNVLKEKFGEYIANGSFHLKNDCDMAKPESLVEGIFQVTAYAVKMNNLLPEAVRVPMADLVKLALLQHIGKSVRFIPNTDAYLRDKKGEIYAYNPEFESMNIGDITIWMCDECDIHLTPSERLVIQTPTIDTCPKSYYYSTALNIIAMANSMYLTELKKNKGIIK